MRPSEALEQHRSEIRRIVLENRSLNPRVFGSVLRGEDTEQSDLDLLIAADSGNRLMDLARIEIALEELKGVRVDVQTPGSLHRNFRDRVVAEAVAL